MIPNKRMIEMWSNASIEYHQEIYGSPAEEYLASRGLDEMISRFRLGYVSAPAPGHEQRFTGMLSIPYQTPSGVIGFKFRAIRESDKKYLIPAGQKTHLFNVGAILKSVDEILIVEGELDAISAEAAGFRAVAVAGANAFKPHFARCFDGIGRVIVVTDNDRKQDGSNPGQDLAKKICDALPNAIRVSLALGEDVNSTIVKHGKKHFSSLVHSVDEQVIDDELFPF